MGSFEVSTPRSNTLENILASSPGFVKSVPVKTPSFKAPKTVGKKPPMIAKGKEPLGGTDKHRNAPLLKDKKQKKETDKTVQAPDDLVKQKGKAPDKNGRIISKAKK